MFESASVNNLKSEKNGNAVKGGAARYVLVFFFYTKYSSPRLLDRFASDDAL